MPNLTASDELLLRVEELSARVERYKQRVSQLEQAADAANMAKKQLEEAGVNASRLLGAALHDLRQPLQTIDLLYDALSLKVKDESSLKVIERLGKAVTSASNITNRISEIMRLDGGRADTGHHVPKRDDAAAASGPREYSVLVVEDDPDLASRLEYILASEGYQVSVAADGWQALELSAPGTMWPDVVIANYHLPNGLGGLDLIVSFQERLDHDVSAIIIAGDVSGGATRAIENHGHACISKPVRPDQLRELVRLALERRQTSITPQRAETNGEDTSTVFVVDDDPSVLEAMRDLLEGAGYAVQAFASGADFVTARRPASNGCVLVDAHMPAMDGFELIERLKAENFALPIIMVTGAGDVPMAVRAMKAGAVDFIEKPVSARELVNCIQNALKPVPSAVTTFSRQNAATARFATLTERQRQIIDLILAGESNKCMAYKLGLSQRTVESHRAAIMRKTGATSFAALVRWAIAAS